MIKHQLLFQPTKQCHNFHRHHRALLLAKLQQKILIGVRKKQYHIMFPYIVIHKYVLLFQM